MTERHNFLQHKLEIITREVDDARVTVIEASATINAAGTAIETAIEQWKVALEAMRRSSDSIAKIAQNTSVSQSVKQELLNVLSEIVTEMMEMGAGLTSDIAAVRERVNALSDSPTVDGVPTDDGPGGLGI